MTSREFHLKTIASEFSHWQIKLENLTSLNLYDANLFSENTILEILNLIFDYKLKHANALSKNHPAIDLLDKVNKISVQVTSTKSKPKIQSTLDKFFENKFDQEFEVLYIIVLGKKQSKYQDLKIKSGYNFDSKNHILDFKDILQIINFLPTERIEKIASLLNYEKVNKSTSKISSNSQKIKRNLALKKRFKKDFTIKLDPKYWEQAIYEPYRRFTYYNVNIRSVDDKSWPNVDEGDENRISSWFKGEFWDFYDNGIELVSLGGRAIFDQKGNWDELNWKGDEREKNLEYTKVNYNLFLRIPYDFIVDYDMETDPYNGLPSIFVEYAKDGMPYESILYGRIGYYNKEAPMESKLIYYFDLSKRKKLI